MPDQETNEIQAGMVDATDVDGPWEFGTYIERLDDGEWTPLIYGGMTEDEAQEIHMRHHLDTGLSSPFRRSRVVRRATSPWELRT